MHRILLWVGRTAGLLGAVVSLSAVFVRLIGSWHLFGMSVGTVLQGGVAAMVLGCLGYAASIVERPANASRRL